MKKTSGSFYIRDSIKLIFFGFLYGVLVYISSERGGPTYDATIVAGFFPLWPILLGSTKSLAHFIRSTAFLVIGLTIQITLYEAGIITAEGVFLVYIIIYVSRFFFYDLGDYFNALSSVEMTDFLATIFGIVVLVQFVIMLLFAFYRQMSGHSEYDVLVSTKYLYVRKERTFSDFEILYDFLMAWIWPLNLQTYRDIYREVKYKKVSLNESWEWDYGRLAFDEIKFMKKKEYNKTRQLLKILTLVAIGLSTITIYIGVFFLILSVRQLWLLRYKLVRVRSEFNPYTTEGSFFMLSSENQFTLIEVPEEVAIMIPSINPY